MNRGQDPEVYGLIEEVTVPNPGVGGVLAPDFLQKPTLVFRTSCLKYCHASMDQDASAMFWHLFTDKGQKRRRV